MTDVKGEKAVEIFGLVIKNKMLPEKVSDLVPLSFIGQAAVTFYRTKVKAMRELSLSEEQRKATLHDGQDAGEMLLEIEKRIGELLPDAEEAKSMGGKIGGRIVKGVPYKELPRGRPSGITKKRAYQSRSIASHPEIVEMVKKQARENEDIPTKTAVLNRIAYEKEKKRTEEAKKIENSSKALIAAEQAQYLNALDRIIMILPQRPPKDWSDQAFREAKTKAKIILKRLEVFINGTA